MANGNARVTRNKILQIAGAVRADPRTVKKVIDGKPVRGSVGVDIENELMKRGIRASGRSA
jgi:hypothetical protein